MKRFLLAAGAVGALSAAVVALPCFASTVTVSMLIENVVLMELQQKYPDFSIRAVKKTDIENVFEVTIRNEIGYLAVKTTDMPFIGKEKAGADPYRFFFLGGNLVDLSTRENLTAKARERLERVDVKTLPVKDAITEKRGTGENVLYVFSDLDCGYCRRLQQTLDQLKNVTIHTFLTPFGAVSDPKRGEKTAVVWCSKNTNKLFHKAMAGEPITGIADCETPIVRNLKLAEKLYIRGTPTMFFADGSRVVGNQLDVKGFEERFKAIKEKNKKTKK